ncbi:MAG: EAL domain-containing protein [Gammaproteobacteria bacterium]
MHDETSASNAVGPNQLAGLLGRLLPGESSKLTFADGAVVVRENDKGDCAYLIERGFVRVTRMQHDGETFIAKLGPGDLFGETALVDLRTRTATVTAMGELEVIPIGRDQLARVLSQSDPLLKLLLRVATDRLRNSMAKISTNSFVEERDESTGTATPAPYDTTRLHAIDELRLEGRIREALRKQEFTLHYQPIVSTQKRTLAGFEALVRWIHPEDGLIGPDMFIDVAERTGLIVPLGAFVLAQACRFAKRFNEEIASRYDNAPPVFMGINVSARQLDDSEAAEAIIDIVRGTGVDPATIKLEITENLFIDRPDMAETTLRKLKKFGLAIAIDDFGTGYSSLSYLRRYPLDTLKIDRSFIVDCDQEGGEGSRAIVKTVCDLAEALGMDVVAEGVETSSQFRAVEELGCTYVQGFLMSKSLSEADAMAMVGGSLPGSRTSPDGSEAA